MDDQRDYAEERYNADTLACGGDPCDCGTVFAASGFYLTHAPGEHEDCTGLVTTYCGEDSIVRVADIPTLLREQDERNSTTAARDTLAAFEATEWARRVDSDTLAAMLSTGLTATPRYIAARDEFDRRFPS